ncbi:MAG: hypothetical protein ACREDY_19910, partial [Bradyrhizobium sp.]
MHLVDAHDPNCRRQKVAAAFTPGAPLYRLSSWHNEYNNAPQRSSSTEAHAFWGGSMTNMAQATV